MGCSYLGAYIPVLWRFWWLQHGGLSVACRSWKIRRFILWARSVRIILVSMLDVDSGDEQSGVWAFLPYECALGSRRGPWPFWRSGAGCDLHRLASALLAVNPADPTLYSGSFLVGLTAACRHVLGRCIELTLLYMYCTRLNNKYPL